MTVTVELDQHQPRTPAIPARVEEVLTTFFDERTGAADSDTWKLLVDIVRDFVLGPGKRVRPQFCYWGWRGGGGADCDEIVAAAAALELFHAFGLIHDDIMDASTTRRGRPSVHHRLADTHASNDWRGSSGRFGVNVGILCGDLCLIWSDELFHTCALPPDRLAAALPSLHHMRGEVCTGQYFDLREQADGGSLAGALRVIRYKTALYTVQRPLQIGGVLAGAPPAVLNAYATFGQPIGEAFQLRDDILGVFGDPAVTGKSTLDDLRDGKPTALMALARQRASQEQLALIDALSGDPLLDEAAAAPLRELLIGTGALSTVEQMIHDRTALALAALECAPIAEPARAELRNLALAATKRSW